MDPDRWQRLESLFQQALARTPAERALFLSSASDDEEMLQELQELLAAHEEGQGLLDGAVTSKATGLPPGALVGRYRIVAWLGSGGMGDVYRARDTELGRDVALKMLPPRLLHEPVARARLTREAKAVATLSHSNILALHDFSSGGRSPYVVMELLEGESLADILAKGLLPLSTVLDYARQIARGLSAAHDKGIVHRDLKPSNLFVTSDGLVKILDFGIAKLGALPALEEADTAPTQPGTVMGTVGYMSPEQVRGSSVDAPSDVFSFGVVLVEMLTGRRAFHRESPIETLAAILREPHEYASRADGALPALEAVVACCLEKEPGRRFPSGRELSAALEGLTLDVQMPRQARRWGKRRRALGALAIVLITGGVVWLALTRLRSIAPAGRSPVVVPLTSVPGREFHPALAPDGRLVAYSWDGGAADDFDLYVRSVESGASRRLTTDAGFDCCASWSPDGRTIAFVRVLASRGVVLLIPAEGGAERRLLDVAAWFGTALSWSPDGRWLAVTDAAAPTAPHAVTLVSVTTGERRTLTRPGRGFMGDAFPSFSPDGRTVAFVRIPASGEALQAGRVELVPIEGGEPRSLTSDRRLIGGLAWSAEGNGLFFTAGIPAGSQRLWRVDLDGRVRQLDFGEGPIVVGGGEAESALSVSHQLRVSVARQGGRVAFARSSYDTNILKMDTAPPARRAPPVRLIASTRLDEAPQYSLDGRRVAFASWRATPNAEIWVCNSDGSACQQLTSLGTHSGTPRWSPDGRTIAFDSGAAGQGDVWLVDVATRATRRLTETHTEETVPSFSRDGRWVYFASDRAGEWQVYRIPVTGGPARQVTRAGGYAAFESADGRHVYYSRHHTPGIWRTPVLGGPEERLTSIPECWGYWTLAPGGIYVLGALGEPRPPVQFFSFSSGTLEAFGTLSGRPACGESGLTLSPDGLSLLAVEVEETADLMLIEGLR